MSEVMVIQSRTVYLSKIKLECKTQKLWSVHFNKAFLDVEINTQVVLVDPKTE